MAVFYAILMVVGVLTICAVALVVTVYRIDKCPHCGKSIRHRSTEQNAKLPAVLQDIASQKQWAGQWLDVEDWKRLITAAWERASGRQARIFPSLDGHSFHPRLPRLRR